METRTYKLMSATNVPIKITPGHFATNHSHIIVNDVNSFCLTLGKRA